MFFPHIRVTYSPHNLFYSVQFEHFYNKIVFLWVDFLPNSEKSSNFVLAFIGGPQ